MQAAVTIFTHALRMIFADPLATLRTILPGLGIFLLALGIGWAMGLAQLFDLEQGATATFEAMVSPDDPQATPSDPVALLLFVLLGYLLVGLIVVLAWIVMLVSWHRYVLLSDESGTPSPLPPAGAVLRYTGIAILLTLITVGASLLIVMPMALAEAVTPIAVLVVGIALNIVLLWLLLRLSLALPAAAIGRSMSIWDSLSKTAPQSRVIFWLAGLSLVFGAVVGYLPGLLFSFSGALELVAEVLVNLLLLLLNASILTTLYGWLVEGRDLSA